MCVHLHHSIEGGNCSRGALGEEMISCMPCAVVSGVPLVRRTLHSSNTSCCENSRRHRHHPLPSKLVPSFYTVHEVVNSYCISRNFMHRTLSLPTEPLRDTFLMKLAPALQSRKVISDFIFNHTDTTFLWLRLFFAGDRYCDTVLLRCCEA